MTGRAVQGECPKRMNGVGACLCKPKCKHCGWGPHMGAHMGTKDDPALAYDHEYEPRDAAIASKGDSNG